MVRDLAFDFTFIKQKCDTLGLKAFEKAHVILSFRLIDPVAILEGLKKSMPQMNLLEQDEMRDMVAQPLYRNDFIESIIGGYRGRHSIFKRFEEKVALDIEGFFYQLRDSNTLYRNLKKATLNQEGPLIERLIFSRVTLPVFYKNYKDLTIEFQNIRCHREEIAKKILVGKSFNLFQATKEVWQDYGVHDQIFYDFIDGLDPITSLEYEANRDPFYHLFYKGWAEITLYGLDVTQSDFLNQLMRARPQTPPYEWLTHFILMKRLEQKGCYFGMLDHDEPWYDRYFHLLLSEIDVLNAHYGNSVSHSVKMAFDYNPIMAHYYLVAFRNIQSLRHMTTWMVDQSEEIRLIVENEWEGIQSYLDDEDQKENEAVAYLDQLLARLEQDEF